MRWCCNGVTALLFSLRSPPARHRYPWSSRPTSRCTWGSRPATETKGRRTQKIRQRRKVGPFFSPLCDCTLSTHPTTNSHHKPSLNHYRHQQTNRGKPDPSAYHDQQHRSNDRPTLYKRGVHHGLGLTSNILRSGTYPRHNAQSFPQVSPSYPDSPQEYSPTGRAIGPCSNMSKLLAPLYNPIAAHRA